MDIRVWVIKNDEGYYIADDLSFVERALCKRFEFKKEAKAFRDEFCEEEIVLPLRVVSRD